MSCYSLALPSSNERFLTKSFTVEDIIDLNSLINNIDVAGIDLFVEAKFKEYTKNNYKLFNVDTFCYLLSQRIFAVSEKLELKRGENDHYTMYLAKLYNDIIKDDFILENEIKYKNNVIKIKYPYNLNDSDKIYAYLDDEERVSLSDLPVNCYKDVLSFYEKNEKLIVQDYFREVFNFNFSLENMIFLEVIQFLFQENVNSIYNNFFTLIHDYNYDIQSLKKFTLRELYLHIIVVNNYNKQKQKNKKQYEPGP